jgi:hypothetical protein
VAPIEIYSSKGTLSPGYLSFCWGLSDDGRASGRLESTAHLSGLCKGKHSNLAGHSTRRYRRYIIDVRTTRLYVATSSTSNAERPHTNSRTSQKPTTCFPEWMTACETLPLRTFPRSFNTTTFWRLHQIRPSVLQSIRQGRRPLTLITLNHKLTQISTLCRL